MSGFSNSILGGQGALVRVVEKSSNYVAGVSGWAIFRNGNAEFNNVTARGELDVGTATSYIHADTSTGQAEILLNPNSVLYNDGAIFAQEKAIDSGQPLLNIISPSPLFGLFSQVQIYGDTVGGAVANHIDLLTSGNLVARITTTGLQITGDLSVSGVGNVQYAESTGNPQTNNTTTLADLTGMVFTAAASARYEVRVRLTYDSPAATDLKTGWTGPAGFLILQNSIVPQAGTADNFNTAVRMDRRGTGSTVVAGGTGGVTTTSTGWWQDCVVDTTNAGNVQFQFAANAAGTASVSLRSYLIATRIA